MVVGGTNDIDNLVVVCKSCHEKLHRTSFKTEVDEDIDNYGFEAKNPNSKISRLINAIKTGDELEIVYEKKDGTTTTRKIAPKIISVEDRRFYLRAFCHLRNTERTFRISRIKKILKN